MSKKLVLKVGVHDEKAKQKAMKAVSSLEGIESLAMDMNEKKLTVIGSVDPVQVVGKLKNWHTELLTVGPAKEPEKKEGEKKEGDKKEGEKKEGGGGDEKKKDSEQIEELVKLYKQHYPQYTHCYRVYSSEEDPNSCVIS